MWFLLGWQRWRHCVTVQRPTAQQLLVGIPAPAKGPRLAAHACP
jgi:hypothetical protein